MAIWLSVALDRNPVRVRRLHLLAHRVRIGPRHHVHVERAASRHQRAEGIGPAQPGAAMVERHFRRVVGDNAAGAERRGVGVKAAEVIDPELRIETAGIVFDQRQLHPTHRSIEPTLQRAGGSFRTLDKRRSARRAGVEPERGERGCAGGDLQEVPAGNRIWHERMPPYGITWLPPSAVARSAWRRAGLAEDRWLPPLGGRKSDRRVQYILRLVEEEGS